MSRLTPLLLIPCLLSSTLLATPAPSDGGKKLSRKEQRAEELFVLARTLLVDKSVTDVSAVPRLLDDSARAGFIPARLKLLEVWEGKFRGLAAQPDKAYTLADEMAREVLAADAPATAHAAQQQAMLRLARYLENTISTHSSKRQAFHWMHEAARRGYPVARAELARYYLLGIGCQKDPIAALKLLKQLTKDAPETPKIYFYLGYLCHKGLGLSRPYYAHAFKYYNLGMQRNDASATNNLATLYRQGLGTEKNTQLALRYYRLAGALGDKTAATNMQELLRELGEDEEQIEQISYTESLYNALLHLKRYVPLSF